MLDLDRRIQTAEAYLELLDQILGTGKAWKDHYEAGMQDDSVLHAYVLLHPAWIPPRLTQRIVQFGRSFGPLDLGSTDSCQASLYWGVNCARRDSMEADHAFPYA